MQRLRSRKLHFGSSGTGNNHVLLPLTLCCRGRCWLSSLRGYCGSTAPPVRQGGPCGWTSAPGRTPGTTPAWTPGSEGIFFFLKKRRNEKLPNNFPHGQNVLVVCEAASLLRSHGESGADESQRRDSWKDGVKLSSGGSSSDSPRLSSAARPRCSGPRSWPTW